jgi:hypothetical protein
MKLRCDICGDEPVPIAVREGARCEIQFSIDDGWEQRCMGTYRNVERDTDFEKKGQINAFEGV